MSVAEVIKKLREKNIELFVSGDNLRVRGNNRVLNDLQFLDLVRKYKNELIEEINSGEHRNSTSGLIAVPPNLIPPGCAAITPAMLPLVSLSQLEIGRIIATMPAGAGNVQDVYPLAPMQEGILFHHLLESDGDVYLTTRLFSVDHRERFSRYVDALQAVIDRHDILRTAVVWEGLPEPLQVVWRRASLVVEEVALDPARGDVAEQLSARFDPRHYRMDVRQPPLVRLFIAEDPGNSRWVALQLMHHIVGDQTTSKILHHEIEMHLLERAGNLPKPLPFRRFVAQARLSVSREDHEEFFTRMLGDVDEPTTPFGLTDAQGDGSGIVEAWRTVDPILSRRLRVCARALNVSAASICHLAWALVLGRVSGRENVVFGTLMLGRMQGGAGVDSALGVFINTLPLRISVGDEGAQASIRTTHELLTKMMRHEYASLALAQRCSAVQAPVPLFTAMLNYRHSSVDPESTEDAAQTSMAWEGITILRDEERTNYPFGLAVDDLHEGFRLNAQVDATVDPERVCELMHTALESLVTALERTPMTPVRCLDVLPISERGTLVTLGDGGASIGSIAGGKGSSLYDLVRVQAARNADGIAVMQPGGQLSYRQLIQCAEGVARRLSELGAGAETRVAILADRSVESLVGVLGILAAGAAYVPLDPSFPAERAGFVLNDASVLALVSPAALSGRATMIARQRAALLDKVIVIGEAGCSESEPISELPLTSRVTPENAAYVIYTSGSTGTPKGVVVEHRSAMNLVRGFLARHDFAGQRLLMIPPLVFDASVGDVFPVLAAGGTLVLHPSPTELGPRELEQFCHDYGITAIDAPAALWRRWTEGFEERGGGGGILPGVQLMMIGGDSVSLAQVRRFARLTQNRVLLSNHYGPTEASVCATMLTTRDGSELSGPDLPIGRPLPGVQVYVLDRDMRLVARGIEGELCIGGAGVARGYLGAPELTAERFVLDPFSSDVEARLYRTGDLVRWNTDGTLQFLGRSDHQVKIRGLRIELGEIEARLAEHRSVREAVVLAREDRPGEKRLVAYYTSAQDPEGRGRAVRAEQLRTHLLASLPEYMVPAAYVHLECLPLTPNGKLDRQVLPEPEGDAYVRREYEAPVGEVENRLAGLWAEVLELERIGRHDNFFELGGHSLLAMTLIERMRRADLPVDVRAVFTTPTLMGLAGAVGGESHRVTVPPNLIAPGCTAITPAMLPLVNLSQGEIDTVVADVPGGAQNVQDIYPLAPLQEGFLFHHLVQNVGDVYLSTNLLSFHERKRLDRYVGALQTVIDRHDILRTAMAWEGMAEPVQVVWRHAALVVEEVQFDAACGDVAEQLRSRFDPRHYRLDVRQAPLWRLFIAEDVPNGRWVVLELMHHLVGDHMTLQVMQQEIREILRGRGEQLPAALPFRDFVAQARLGVSREEHEEFFGQMLGDVQEPTAPFGLTDVQGDGSKIVEGHRELEPGLCERLRARARALGVTAASVCHLAWALVLARVSGRDDVVFGTVMFGRMQGGAGADRAMGIFINTLPLRIRVKEAGAQASVRETHRLLTQLLKHEHAPLGLAQRCSGVRAPAPLFTALLNYRYVGGGEAVLVRDAVGLDEDGAGVDEGGSEAAPVRASMEFLGGQERSNYPFDLSINDLGEGFSLDAQVDGSIDPQRVCALMQTALESLVRALEETPNTPVHRLEVLPPEERQRVLYGWNETRVPYGRESCIQELFEAQAAKTPDAIAVVCEAQRLTYGELNREANRLAHRLRGLGVKAEDRVGICVQRGVSMVVGMLGILKAGGGYVPLDPSYPVQRLQYMVRDSEPVVLVVDLSKDLRTALSELLNPQLSTHAIPVLDLAAKRSDLPQARDGTDAAGGDPGAERVGAQEITENPDPAVVGLNAHHLAYVIYTSGSTGQPKGVMVEHGNAVNLIHTHIEQCKLEARDRVLQFASIGFDASVEEIFPPLSVGATVVVRAEHVVAPDEEFERFLDEQRITVAELPTAFWHQWSQHGEARDLSGEGKEGKGSKGNKGSKGSGEGEGQLEQLEQGKQGEEVGGGARGEVIEAVEAVEGLRLVVVGGEKAERRHWESWRQSRRGRESDWLNTYGPTEATVYASALLVQRSAQIRAGEIPIGRAVSNAQIYILDAHRQPVPMGVAGELYIGGLGVARGYLNRPELTAERFITDPFSAEASARMYRTGDVGRYLVDGSIEYLGRNDHQVKIRGFRIELGEIEARLVEHPSVGEAVVLAREERAGDQGLVAYVTPASAAGELNNEVLRTHLLGSLPPYMVPAAYVRLESLPLTANGKLDRGALPAPDEDAYVRRGYEAPVGEVEKTLARIWAQVLKLEQVGRHDNFFELGGHSLLAIKLVSFLQQLEIKASIAQLFNYPTISLLAKSVDKPLAPAFGGILEVRRGTQIPLFMVHDGYGDDVYFYTLAQYLPEQLTIYGLPSIPHQQRQPHTMCAMAAKMVHLIQQLQPSGPYRLVGWSFGGVLAYEISQQMLGRGQIVEFLGLLDSYCPARPRSRARMPGTPTDVLIELCAPNSSAKLYRNYEPDPLDVVTPGIEFRELFNRYRSIKALPEHLDGLSPEIAWARCRYLGIHSRVQDDYRPKPINIPVYLFVAAERDSDPESPAHASLGWDRWISEERLHLQQVPGNHASMMKLPNIKQLGARLTEAIAASAGTVAAVRALGVPTSLDKSLIPSPEHHSKVEVIRQ